MTPERRQQIEDLFHAALARPPGERASFLAAACASDPDLKAEVESLIAAHEQSGNFLDAPAYQGTAEFLAGEGPTQPGIEPSVGPYRILNRLGVGGVGEVYLAQDTRLGRRVALKVLSERFKADETARRRFIQEARATSALNHPHIVTIYDIGSEGGRDYIAMEYVEGEPLRKALSHEKLDIRQALELTAQTASGLAAAHDAGVIHRDIKPENLVVSRSGQIKILDFGLAKLVEKQRQALIASTATTAAYDQAAARAETIPGTIMGTVAYMSPEQAEGRALDHRTDIFSLGVVLYELLTGRRPFAATSAIGMLHAIVNDAPPPAVEVNPRLPVEALDILDKALAKEPEERYHHIKDFEIDLRRLRRAIETNSLISSRLRAQLPDAPPVARRGGRARLLWAAVGALLVLAATFGAWWLGRSTAPRRGVALANVTLTPLTTEPGYEGEPTFSPDGQTIAYVSDRNGNFEIFLKQISGGPDINITNNGADDVQPAFSPDGKQIAFVSTRASSSNLLYPGVDFSLMGGDIWVMPALGGSPRRIAQSGNFPSWSPDGTTIIYMSSRSWFQPKMRRVAAQGGEPQDIPIKFKADEPPAPFWLYPSYSSDGRWIAFEAGGKIFVVSAEGGEPKQIVRGRRPVWSVDAQAIIFSNNDPGKNLSLWQVPFSTAEGTISGAPQPLTVGRGRDTQAAVSRDGKQIAFAAQDLSFNIETLPFDAETGRQTGAPQPATLGSNIIYFLSFSPDGRSIVFQSHRGTSSHIWRVDLGSPPVQLTSDPNFNDSTPRWSPDGQTVAFIRRPANESPQPIGLEAAASLWLMSSDGANPRLLIENAGNPAWAPDGRALAYRSVVDGRQNQLYIFDLATKSARRLTNEPGVVPISTFSPDGKWLIYQSNPSGNVDLRAMPVEGGEPRVAVATPHQDYHPFVSPSGKWLYFQLDHKNIYRVPGPAQDWRQAQPEKVTNFPESGMFLEDPQISRDGRWLLYSRGRITGDIWLMKR